MPKGDVLCVSRVAGIMAAKKTSELIPMCHPLNITSVDIDFDLDDKNNKIGIKARVKDHRPDGCRDGGTDSGFRSSFDYL